MTINEFINSSVGKEKADIVFKNGRLINVFTSEIMETDLAIKDGVILGFGEYEGLQEVDLHGRYLAPGLVDAHVHIESSLTTPGNFSSLIVPYGTTSVIADPHEIANVLGLEGIKYMLEASRNIPLDTYFMLPSCVPATHFENSGSILEAEDLAQLIDEKRVLGLGEVMNYPGLLSCDKKVVAKINLAREKNKHIDGHSPMLTGTALNAYVGAGVETDHECTSIEEMNQRLQRGMYVLIRDGSAAKNLEELIMGVNSGNFKRCAFCTDDKQPKDIIENGHINFSIRKAVALGLDPIWALQMATINACECYGLHHKGALVPGYVADIVVFDNLLDFNVQQVYKNGTLVAEKGKMLTSPIQIPNVNVRDTIHIQAIASTDFAIHMKGNRARIIRVLPHSILTDCLIREVEVDDTGYFISRQNSDVLKMAVIERHKATGNIGLGLVENYGLREGAIASSIAHDSHNIIAIGDNDEDMTLAVHTLEQCGGGICITSKGNILGLLELPIAGLMSDKSAKEVSAALKALHQIAVQKLHTNIDLDPFMTLAFLALPVIPALKLTDKGLFDVISFKLTDICVEKD